MENEWRHPRLGLLVGVMEVMGLMGLVVLVGAMGAVVLVAPPRPPLAWRRSRSLAASGAALQRVASSAARSCRRM